MSYKLNNYKSKGMNTQVMDKLKIHLPNAFLELRIGLFGLPQWATHDKAVTL